MNCGGLRDQEQLSCLSPLRQGYALSVRLQGLEKVSKAQFSWHLHLLLIDELKAMGLAQFRRGDDEETLEAFENMTRARPEIVECFSMVIAHGVGRKVLRDMRMPDSPSACRRPRFMF